MSVFRTDARKILSLPSTRRSFWSSRRGKAICLAAGSLALAGFGAFLYATRVEINRFRLETVDVTTGAGPDPETGKKEPEAPMGSLPAAPKRQLKVLHLSDLHLCGDDYDKADFLRQVTEDEYDIIVLTGDIFETYSGIKFASSLIKCKPRIGAFAVLGNHDYYSYSMFNKTVGRIVRRWRHGWRRDVAPIVGALKEVGFTVLQNEIHAVPEHDLFVVGIDWPGIEEEHLQELMVEAPDGHFVLCLFHLPKNLEYISNAGVDLAVGGHTHGGQVRIPGFGAIITDSELPRHEAAGIVRRGNTVFHISRGLGADPRTNIRFFCPPAVTVINVSHYERS
jgi:predicted MPP superfamily phosphohydrolase